MQNIRTRNLYILKEKLVSNMKRHTLCAAAVTAAAAAIGGGLFYAYNNAFQHDPKRQAGIREIPDGELYAPHKELMLKNIDALLKEPYERITIRSHDGLKLVGKYYAGPEGAPLILFFHGYRSTAERDASGGFWYCRERGYSLLMVDQRALGESEGRSITFGIKERQDCLTWVNEVIRRFGPDIKILLAGISMGAATVLMAAELPLPENVRGIWADCGFDTPEGILRETIRQRRMPEKIVYPLVHCSGRLLAGIKVDSVSAVESLRHAKVPVLLIHGEEDEIVPLSHAYALRDACASPVTLLTVPHAAHGISYYVDTDAYWAALDELCSHAFSDH